MRNLITAQEVIDLAFAENSNMMAESISDTSIRIAEIKYIRPAFGAMYPLLADKYADFTNDYVKPALAYFVKCEIVSSIAIDMSNSGVAVANPQYQSAATDKQRQRLYDSEMSKAKTLLDFALEHIATHSEEFPDFCGEAPKKHHRVGGILLGGGTSRNQSASIAGEAFKNEIEQLSKDVAGKVDKVEGKGLSTNDYTNADKEVVDRLAEFNPDDISTSTLYHTTYLELRELRNNGLLEPGAYYRITDFVTTTSKEGTKSAGHPFDIVVLALDERTLAEDAYAMLHEGDTYFANSNLSAWRLKYSFDNDFDRFEWAVEDSPEKAQSWTTSWGVLESKNNAEPSSNYLTAEVDGVTKYLYAPANRGTYLNNKTFYRELGTKDILSPNELIFEADDAPYEEDGYYSWEWISQMRARTADGTIVDRLYNDGGSEFYAEDDYNSGDWQYPVEFDPNPTYDEDRGVYIYTISRGGDAWWNDYHGGKIEVVEKEQYNGSKDALFYAFDAPLPQTTTQAKPQIYSVETGHIYKSNNWSDTVRYSAYAPFQWNGGRGVIYSMLDEWQNEAGYDFKNILTTYSGKDYYTFSYVSGSTIVDRTLACEYCINNKITPYIVNTSWNDNSVSGGRYRLGGIVFKDTTVNKSLRNNFFGNGCNTIVLGSGCRDNYFGEFCTNITLGDNCYNNIFNKSCSYITLKSGSATTSSDAQYLIYCEFDVNTKYVQLWNSGTASSTQAVRYYRVSQSVSGTSSAVSVIQVNRGKTTDTRLAKNSSGTIKQWCDADLA